MSADRSTRVISNSLLRWKALLPPPLPSSSTVRAGGFAVRSKEAAKDASPMYSSGAEISGHQDAMSA